jgi:hypothetical protein
MTIEVFSKDIKPYIGALKTKLPKKKKKSLFAHIYFTLSQKQVIKWKSPHVSVIK